MSSDQHELVPVQLSLPLLQALILVEVLGHENTAVTWYLSLTYPFKLHIPSDES